MGVRFACHACGKRLNIKSELAGRRGICPSCSVRFRIPEHDSETSTPIEHRQHAHASVSEASDGYQSSHAAQTDNARVENAQAAEFDSADQADFSTENSHVQSFDQPIEQQTVPNQTASSSRSESPFGDQNATWYVRPPSGGQYGPADGLMMQQWVTEGRVAESAMLWRDGWPDWRLAKEIIPSKGSQPQLSNGHPSAGGGHGGDGDASAVGVTSVSHVHSPSIQPQVAGEATSGESSGLKTDKKVLGTNKRKVSRKRIAMSVVLGLVFLVLVAALVGVVMNGSG